MMMMMMMIIMSYSYSIPWGKVALIPEPRAHVNNARLQSSTRALAYSYRQVCRFFFKRT